MPCDNVPSNMPKGYLRTHCKTCGGSLAEVGTLSKRGKCARCGFERATRNAVSLKLHAGPEFDHWRRRSLAALGVIVLDETESGR